MINNDPLPSDQTETNRLEAFSDGVFAVAITLLALNLTVPMLQGGGLVSHLGVELLNAWPTYLAYSLSFLTILILYSQSFSRFLSP